ncbi:MAG: DUF1905 domain-containing protein [Candidatus Nanopelagicales bacterium]
MEFRCSGRVFEWRGPAPYYFVATSPKISSLIRERSRQLSYGWGVIQIHGKIKEVPLQTAIIPKDGVYFIPIKDAVRKDLEIEVGDRVTVEFNLGKK